MKWKYTPEHSLLVLWADIFFVVVAGWWIFGIYTTFFQGRIPTIKWTTDHNIILGVLWIIVLGQGVPVPAKTFRKICGIVAMWQRGYLYLPIFLVNLLIQLYFWIMIVTVWFPQPLPSPFQNINGGFVTGLISLVIMFPVCAVSNSITSRLLLSLTQKGMK